MRLLKLSLLVSASAALVFAAIPAAGATPSRCARASHAVGAKIAAHDAVAVVFTRNRGGGSFDFYACLRTSSRVVAIPDLCCSDAQFQLAGRFVLYSYHGSAIGDESSKIDVLDLRTRRREAIVKLQPNAEGGGQEIDNGGNVVRLLVSATGAAFWLESPRGGSGSPYELRGATGNPETERIIDAGDIDPGSLRLSHRGTTLAYTIGGAPKSVTISHENTTRVERCQS